MKYHRRSFRDDDFIKIRDFLKQTYEKKAHYVNWHIDRWSFTRYFAQPIHGTFSTWPKTVGIWDDEQGNLAGIVNSEGEKGGEAFFQLSPVDFSDEFIKEMIEFAEKNLAIQKEGHKEIYFRIDEGNRQFTAIFLAMGYTLQDWKEAESAMEITQKLEVRLPPGFTIAEAHRLDNTQKGLAHVRAFSNTGSDNPEGLTERIKGYEYMRKSPDYNPELDLSVLDEQNEVASFVTLWYDDLNQIGILEPVGTIPKYRKMGLGKAVIYEGINRIRAMGAKKVYVGSDQQFYHSIGFKVVNKNVVLAKHFI